MQVLFVTCCRQKVYQNALIERKLPFPEKSLVALLSLQVVPVQIMAWRMSLALVISDVLRLFKIPNGVQHNYFFRLFLLKV